MAPAWQGKGLLMFTRVHVGRRLAGSILAGITVFATFLTMAAAAAAAPLTFAPAVTQASLGKNTTYNAVGDFNRDGHPDIVAVNYTSSDASVYLGDGHGGFFGPTLVPVGANPKACVLRDMDGNGTLDLVVSLELPDAVAVLKGNGAGGFGAPTLYRTAHNEQLAVTDLNRDGRPDIITVNDLIPGGMSVLLANRRGGFDRAQTYSTGPNPRFIAPADFNLDGNMDVVVAFEGNGITGNVVQLWTGNGRGTLRQSGQWTAGTTPKSVSVGDFNRDGRPDFVVSSEGTNDVRLFLGDGRGHFTLNASVGVGDVPKFVLATDINSDGFLDAVAADYLSNNVAVMLGDGAGHLGPPTYMSVGNGPKCIGVADFNGDGRPDMVTADNDGSTVSFLISTSVMPAVTDLAVNPATFSPNADTYQDKTTISYTTNESLYNTVAVYDAGGTLWKTLKSSTVLPAGQQTFVWDGRYTPPGGTATYVPDGTYSVRVTAVDGAGNAVQSSAPVTVDTTISKIGVTQSLFSPNGDGRRDTTSITYALTRDASVTMFIRDASGAIVRTIQDAVAEVAGGNQAVWDGTLGDGSVAPEGTYTAVVRAVNSIGTIESIKTGITVDLTPPVVSDATASPSPFVPPATTTISFSVNEPGTVTVNILDAAKMIVRTLDQDTVVGVNSITWDGTDGQGMTVPAGTYSVRVSVNDQALNKATVYPVVLSVDIGQ
jgi:flagellar hook assembly protein FlgD